MKIKLLTLGVVLFSSYSQAQISVFDIMPPRQITNAQLANNSQPVITGGNLFTQNGANTVYTFATNKEVIASNQIRLNNTTRLDPSLSGAIRLHICDQNKAVYSYSHSDLSHVEALKKLELGIELPSTIQTRIDNFLATDDSLSGLNPFLAWDVDVVATFQHIQSGFTKKIHGFYFQDYERNTTAPNFKNWNWDKLTIEHPIRIRYALPEKLGLWSCTITVFVEGIQVENYCAFDLNVDANTDGDAYVKVGANKQTLERDNDLFFPIGQNLVWPETHCEEFCGCHYNIDPCGSAAHIEFENTIDSYADNGSNSFRMLLFPGALDIEFEKVGNYYDRLNYAWEIDNIVEQAEENDLYIDFNMLVHYGLSRGSAYALYAWDWSDSIIEAYDDDLSYQVFNSDYVAKQNGYATDLNLTLPELFLTDLQAKKFYKQKLRYLISRYGYSTHIWLFELLSEINQVGDKYKPVFSNEDQLFSSLKNQRYDSPYGNSAQHRQNTYLWQDEMAKYIKNELDHTEHLLTCSYAGNPASDDPTFGIPELDIACFNRYPDEVLNFLNTGSKNVTNEIKNYHNQYQKPVFFSESGPLSATFCDNNTTYTQNIWQLMFSGLAGFNIWNKQTLGNETAWQELRKAQDWVQNTPEINYLLRNSFTAYNQASIEFAPNYAKEINFLVGKNTVGNNETFLVGCLVNLTDNYYTNGVGSNSWCLLSNDEENNPIIQSELVQLQQKTNLTYLDHEIDPGLPGLYWDLNWYDRANFDLRVSTFYDANQLIYSSYWVHPISCLTGDCLTTNPYSPLIPFTGSRNDNASWQMLGTKPNQGAQINYQLTEPILSSTGRISTLNAVVFPNPARESITVHVENTSEVLSTAKILDMTGRVVADKVLFGETTVIDISNLSTGIYRVHLFSNNELKQEVLWRKL